MGTAPCISIANTGAASRFLRISVSTPPTLIRFGGRLNVRKGRYAAELAPCQYPWRRALVANSAPGASMVGTHSPTNGVDAHAGSTNRIHQHGGASRHRLYRHNAEVLHSHEDEDRRGLVKRVQGGVRGAVKKATGTRLPSAKARSRSSSGPAPASTTGRSSASPTFITRSNRLYSTKREAPRTKALGTGFRDCSRSSSWSDQEVTLWISPHADRREDHMRFAAPTCLDA